MSVYTHLINVTKGYIRFNNGLMKASGKKRRVIVDLIESVSEFCGITED